MPGSVELNSELFKYVSKEGRRVLLTVRWGSIPEVWYRVRNVFVRKYIVRIKKDYGGIDVPNSACRFSAK
jgi:hypothetical protein